MMFHQGLPWILTYMLLVGQQLNVGGTQLQILLHMKCLHESYANYMPVSIEKCEPKLDVEFVIFSKTGGDK